MELEGDTEWNFQKSSNLSSWSQCQKAESKRKFLRGLGKRPVREVNRYLERWMLWRNLSDEKGKGKWLTRSKGTSFQSTIHHDWRMTTDQIISSTSNFFFFFFSVFLPTMQTVLTLQGWGNSISSTQCSEKVRGLKPEYLGSSCCSPLTCLWPLDLKFLTWK